MLREIKAKTAKTFWERFMGLMGKSEIPEASDGLLIEPCNSIHCFFMRFAIDAVFLDRENKVLKIKTCLPWSLGPLVLGAQKVLELRAGLAGLKQLQLGDRLSFV